ncbi:MAG: efflux RND transporter permease subunit [Bacteroidota bacterium]|nr:efflux RND transporter permease subunit [Bacteroidota bacterium]
MWLQTTSIRRPVTTAMLFLAVVLFGIFSYNQLSTDLLPEIDIPKLTIQTSYPNAAPEEVEASITEPIEASVGTITGIKKVTSTSREGLSFVIIEFLWGSDMDFAALHVREKLDQLRYMLPKEAGRPTIIRLDPSSFPIMTLVVTSKKTGNSITSTNVNLQKMQVQDKERLVNLKEFSRLVIKRRLEQIDGVAQASILGGLEREIQVNVNMQLLKTFALSIEDVVASISAANVNLPGGDIKSGWFRFSLRILGELQTVEEIKNTVIIDDGKKKTVRIKDVAEVLDDFKERQGISRLNGKETISILVKKEVGSNTVNTAGEVQEVIKQLNEEYKDFNISVIFNQSEFINDAISNVEQEVLYGGFLAFIVLFLFLYNIRDPLIIGITIPTSLLATFLLMYFFGVNLNIISMGGLAVGVGMLLDNSIVVIENISRHRQSGKSLIESATLGASEVGLAITASTLTTVAVFLPLIYIKGIAAELFRDQSLSITISLMASLFVAMTLIPMLASRKKIIKTHLLFDYKNTYFIKRILNPFFYRISKTFESLFRYYERLLLYALDNRLKILVLTIILFALTVFLIVIMPKEFIPNVEQHEFILEAKMPRGTSLYGTSQLVYLIENELTAMNSIEYVLSNIGIVDEYDVLNITRSSIDRAEMYVKIKKQFVPSDAIKEIRKKLDKFKNVSFAINKPKSTFEKILNPSENDIQIKVVGKDLNTAAKIAQELLPYLKSINNLTDIRLGFEKGIPEYLIEIDRAKAAMYGLTVRDISNFISTIFKGREATTVSDFDKKITLLVRATEADRDEIYDLLNNSITTRNGEVQLRAFIKYRRSEGYLEICRENNNRQMSVLANFTGSNINEIINTIKEELKPLNIPAGYSIEVGGVNEEMQDALKGLIMSLLLSIALMYMILAAEFESLRIPFIIIFSIPLAIVGAIVLLFVTGQSLSVISLIGLIILVGIADNDAVVKIDFILRKRRENLSVRNSIIEAGKQRFRPIVMNTLTVVFALIPMMLSTGAGSQLQIALSIAIVGGLLSSTFLTLIVVPILYSFFDKDSSIK